MDQVDAAVDQPAGEAHLIGVHAVPQFDPRRMDDRHVTGPLGRLYLANDVAGGGR